ncbi:hypothetical protein FLPS109957_11435 [Flavobacterium psychrophilum]
MVPTATLIAPVVGFKVTPTGHTPEVDIVALPLTPKVAGNPFTTSFNATFGMASPPVDGAVPLSATGHT